MTAIHISVVNVFLLIILLFIFIYVKKTFKESFPLFCPSLISINYIKSPQMKQFNNIIVIKTFNIKLVHFEYIFLKMFSYLYLTC